MKRTKNNPGQHFQIERFEIENRVRTFSVYTEKKTHYKSNRNIFEALSLTIKQCVRFHDLIHNETCLPLANF